MNSDIRVHVGFPTHPKTKKLKRILGSDGVLSLITLWTFAAQNRPDGALTGMDLDDISIAAGWEGDEQEFVSALKKTGWLEEQDRVLVLHDWAENNPWAADAVNRSERARKAAEKRWQRAKEQGENDEEEQPEDASGNAGSMRDALQDAQNGNAPFLSLPSPTLPEAGEHTAAATLRNLCEAKKADILRLRPQIASIYALEAEKFINMKAGRTGVDPYVDLLKWMQRAKPEAGETGRQTDGTYTTPKSAMDDYEPPHVAELRRLREAANGK